MGRPKKKKKEVFSERVTIRLNKSQFADLKCLALEEGVNISAFARRIFMESFSPLLVKQRSRIIDCMITNATSVSRNFAVIDGAKTKEQSK